MEFRYQLCRIEMQDSLQDCGKKIQECLGIKLNLHTVYHPHTDGQSERTIQTIEDMLRACVLDFKRSKDDH